MLWRIGRYFKWQRRRSWLFSMYYFMILWEACKFHEEQIFASTSNINYNLNNQCLGYCHFPFRPKFTLQTIKELYKVMIVELTLRLFYVLKLNIIVRLYAILENMIVLRWLTHTIMAMFSVWNMSVCRNFCLVGFKEKFMTMIGRVGRVADSCGGW